MQRKNQITEKLKNNYNNKIKSGIKFPIGTEKIFLQDYRNHIYKNFYYAMIPAIFIFAISSILDYILIPEYIFKILFIRFAIIIPIIIFLSTIFHIKKLKDYIQYIFSITAIVVSIGIIFIISTTRNEAISSFNYTGLILVIIWIYTITRLRMKIANFTTLIIVSIFEYTEININNALATPFGTKVFITNNFFILSAAFLSMGAGFLIEKYSRKVFLQRINLQEKQKLLIQERNELIEIQNENELDLKVAKQIQLQQIPSDFLNDNLYAVYKPISYVGGDFFDILRFREKNLLGIFISDVMGHGISAALITTMIKTIITGSNRLKNDPCALMSNINNVLMNRTGPKFITAIYCIYDDKTHKITYSNAGHFAPYIITDGKIIKPEIRGGPPIGVFMNENLQELNKNYYNGEFYVPPKSKVFFYTDGLIEIQSKDNKKLFFESLVENVLLENSHLNSKEFTKNILKSVIDFHGSETLDDDICLICLQT